MADGATSGGGGNSSRTGGGAMCFSRVFSAHLFLSRPPSFSGRHRCRSRHCCGRCWLLSDNCPRPITILLRLDSALTTVVSSSSRDPIRHRPLPLATAAIAVADVGLLSDHRPQPITVLLHPDRTLTTVVLSFRVPVLSTLAAMPTVVAYVGLLSYHHPRPITILRPNRALTTAVRSSSRVPGSITALFLWLLPPLPPPPLWPMLASSTTTFSDPSPTSYAWTAPLPQLSRPPPGFCHRRVFSSPLAATALPPAGALPSVLPLPSSPSRAVKPHPWTSCSRVLLPTLSRR